MADLSIFHSILLNMIDPTRTDEDSWNEVYNEQPYNEVQVNDRFAECIKILREFQ